MTSLVSLGKGGFPVLEVSSFPIGFFLLKKNTCFFYSKYFLAEVLETLLTSSY